jgi:hypothetical protein
VAVRLAAGATIGAPAPGDGARGGELTSGPA